MKTIIHVNQHVIKANRKENKNDLHGRNGETKWLMDTTYMNKD